MATIALVACAKAKERYSTYAALLYKSPLFRKSLLYALSNSHQTYILSAKHGLLNLDSVVEPYDVTLKKLDADSRIAWSQRVSEQLKEKVKPRDTVILLAGREYFSGLRTPLAKIGCRIEIPLGSLSLGHRLQRLAKLNHEEHLSHTITNFYSALKTLYVAQEGGRRLVDCSGKLLWPHRGVYFFLDDAEEAQFHGRKFGMPRVARVGTHAVSAGSKSTLWHRLSTHRGTFDGLGSHRSSIFRLHVGRAHMSSTSNSEKIDTWGMGQSAPKKVRETEVELERRVSRLIGSMRVLWVSIPDPPSATSDRAFIERNAIGALSRQNILTRKILPHWLGNFSPEFRIALSGLWNLNHLFVQPHAEFVSVLRHYVEVTTEQRSAPSVSIAPKNWNQIPANSSIASQLSMFSDEKV